MRYLSVCSGIEAATVAWSPLGWQAVGFAEIEKFPSAVLAHHYGSNMPGEPLPQNGVPNYGDFTSLIDAPPECDLLVGGTPCQAFSIAGLRQSLADDRGNLTLQFVRLCHALKRQWPDSFRSAVWENVPGVLNTPDNAFGCFLGGLVGANDALHFPGGGKWPDAGMVSGPRARAAWRILDAQHFGLAQRRRRVFVVVDFGGGADPAAVLFERQSLRGHSAPGRETGQDLAPTISARTSGGGGLGTDFDLDGGLICADVAPTLNACFGEKQGLENQHIDGGAGLFVAHALRGEGFDASEDGTGRGTPIVPIAFSSKDYGADAGDLAPTLRAGGHDGSHANAGVPPAIAFAIQAGALRENPESGPRGVGVKEGIAYTLEAQAEVQVVAFAQNTRDEVRLFGGDGQTVGALAAEPGMKQQSYVATHETAGTMQSRQTSGGFHNSIDHAAGGYMAIEKSSWAVRRLTPRECERLQGFPDDYTAIAWRGKDVADCPDGPRYKSLGNSMAVPVMAWIGRRIDLVMRGTNP